MNMIALPRATYSNLVERQRRADMAIAKLQERVAELSQDELKPQVAARIERRSQTLDAGKGKHFKTIREVRAHFRAL